MRHKFSFFNNNSRYYYLIFSYIVLFALVLFSYKNIGFYEEKIKNLLLNKAIGMVDDTSQNILDEILVKSNNFVHSNLKNESLRIDNEKTLALMHNQDIQSMYVLYLFEDKYFFLLDADKVETSDVSEPFIPENIKIFKEVAVEKKKQIFVQDKIQNLSFTLIKPIIENNKTVAILVIDYTENRLMSLLNVSVEFLKYLLFALLLLSFMFIFYIIYTRYAKYKMYRNPETNTLNRIYMTDNYDKIDFKKYYAALADIDFFKRVNSLYGQKNGDKIIISMIQVISPLLDKKDMLIQYSGEEFLFLILKDKRTEQEFRDLLEEIRIEVEETRFIIGEDVFSLTVSMGALLNTGQEKSLQDVIHKTDTALYESKHAGRNRICYFDISQTQKLYRERLKEMIESDKLVCYYQAIRDLETGELHHYEALLRIIDGENTIFPDKILPSLEDSYLYSFLTKRVIEYNVQKLREDSKIKIAVNLSADDLLNESILSILAQNADLSNRLYIEILENKSIDYEKVELSLQKLKTFGYKICIDDFGSGYSNLNHLLNLSIDYLKIDGSIIKEVPYDKRAYSIVKTFAIFCQQNNMEMIAEFIDSQEVVDILKSFGVKYGQGWYFSKAVPYSTLDKEHL